jgi:O-antigen ligase
VLTSFTRGAWLGLFAAAGGVLLLYFWRQLRIPLLLGGLFVAVFLVSKLSPDSDQDMQSRKSSSLSERMFSVSNTQTDISNRERFNRWAAAVRMIEERPWLGFGPGTYAMQYAPFQRSMNKTPISTNQGVQGTTHNELLLAGSEMGIPAMFIVLLIYATTLLVALRGFLRTPQRWKQTAYAIAAGGLITYYVHGLVNNFLDQDKVAIPVYLCMAMLVALDIYHRDDPTPTEFAQTKVRGRHPVT